LVHEAIKDRLETRYVTHPGQHYDMYEGENLKAARATAVRWFIKHLGTD